MWSAAFGGVVCPSHALIVSLDALVSNSIYDENGAGFPLADGSIVQIIASGDAVIDPFQTYGGTNLLSNSTTGDDVILYTAVIGENETPNSGRFFASLDFDTALYTNVYIRFFNSQGPLTGMIYWGTSAMYQVGVTLGVATVDFNPNDNLSTTNYNNFVIIPEPSTGSLFVVVAGMLWALRARSRNMIDRDTG